MSEDTAVRRGRGRPKGSLNLKTIAKQKQMHDATTSDVTFNDVSFEPWEHDEEEKQEPEEAAEVEPEEPVESEEPEAPPPKRTKREKVVKVPEEDEEESPPVRVVKRKPRAITAPEASPPLTYLQVLQKGLAAAKATQKAEKVQRYDAYFSHL